MKTIPFRRDWEFVFGDHEWMEPAEKRIVVLPQDYISGNRLVYSPRPSPK